MYLRSLTVLMWKHWLVRQNKYFSSFVEFFVPVLPFVLIYIFREKLFPETSEAFIGVEKPEVISLRNSNGPPCVLFTPDTDFTRALMGLVGNKLNLDPLKKLDTNSQGYFPFNNASTIFIYTKSMGPDEAVVVFHNVLGLSLPDSLNYSIRMKTPLSMQILTKGAYNSVSMADKENGAVHEPFIKLQWAIDTSFIQLLTGKKVTQEMTLEEFPYTENLSATSTLKSSVLILAANIGIMPIFFTFMLRIIIEKASGIQELMKMAGVTTQTLVTSHILNILLPGLIYSVGGTVLMKLGPSAVLSKSNDVLIFLAFFLQFIVTVFVALVGSFLARLVSPTALTVLTLYILLTLPAFVLNDMNLRNCFYLCGLTPFMPLIWIMIEACQLDNDSGLTLETIMEPHSVTSFPILIVYLYFILQIIMCLVLFWYFDKVIPGLYGSQYPWYFPFQKSYWSKTSEKPYLTRKISTQAQNPKYFEALPESFEVGIETINVTKVYSKLRALDNVSLEVYKGEITALIGHNGAGKSTLISVITGMTTATKGKVLVNGLDISLKKTMARQHVGLCPQQNIFLDNVSVIEHVMFFTLLNKGTFKSARKWSKRLLVELNLEEKANKYTSALSGGMKRRAQLACALASQASVLLLDEPTSGLDVETRRSLWDLLLSLRETHTVLLSTHFMEEADALADRVVALHTGHLYCHATPMFLKRALGTGYRLTFTTIEEPNEPAITSVIRSVVPKATVKEINLNSVSYILPSSNSRNFPKLFSKLESRKSELGIDSIGVGTTTLEEVFLKLYSDVIKSTLDEDEWEKEKKYKKRQPGVLLYVRQTQALLKRYLRFVWNNKMTQIVFGCIPIVILILVITEITNDSEKSRTEKTFQTMNLDLYGPLSLDYNILYKVDGPESDLRPLSDQYPRVNFERASDIGEAVLRTRTPDKKEKYLAGIELNDTDAKVLYTTKVRHIAPVALNLLSNLIATRTIPWATGSTITVHSHPLPNAFTPHDVMDLELPKRDIVYWCFYITLMLLSGFTLMIQLPCLEASGARHIHLMAGCSPEMHWVAMLLAAALHVLIVYVSVLVIACVYLDYDKILSNFGFIIATSVVVLLGSMAVLAFSFQITFCFRQSVAIAIILLVMVLSMFIFPVGLTLVPAAAKFQLPLLIVLPPYTFSEAMIACSSTAYINALCKLNRNKCPIVSFPFPYFDSVKCCESKSDPWCYFCFEKPGPGKEIMYLTAQIIIYMIFVTITERGAFLTIEEKIKNSFYKDADQRCNEDSVNAEQAYVEEAIAQKSKEDDCNVCDEKIPDVMLVSNVHKKYQDCCSSVAAVKGVSFSVKKGECFGLLGVNGAGKSTMFQMLTAIQCPTKGRIFANEHENTFPYSTKYLHSLSYCPQFWGLDDFLTGRQTLALLLALNGLSSRDTNTETMFWIRLVGLEEHADKLVSSYSGGCLRRIAAASALCTGAPIILLDEPTAGVDVAARRCLWAAFKRALDEERAIIITSHSLDEMEVLCDRVAIMVAGEICALGSPAALRANHDLGHSVVLKIKNEHNRKSGNRDRLDLFKATMKKKFECTLNDERKTMLHYRINKTIKYSKLFRMMEQLQASFSDLIEDYSVSETTLEEVFLSFTNK